jgi:hypothetical protein
MREITTHRVNPANDKLTLQVIDEPGSGGAQHLYEVSGYKGLSGSDSVLIEFQNGPIAEAGVNGVTHEVLLAILIDRLEAFQAGPFANRFNAAALGHLQEAQRVLFERTRERMGRGVEGTHQK